MPPTDLIKPLPDDSFLTTIKKRRKKSLTETVPDDIDPREALANIKECVMYLGELGNATSAVGAILGRHMAIAAKRPEIYEAAGYDSLKAFEQAEIIDKVSHGSVWSYKAINEAFPDITIEQVLTTGSTNLLRAARVCKSIDASPSQRKKILDKAGELNTAQFTVEMEKITGKGSTTTDSFLLIGSSADLAMLKEDLADPHIEEVTGATTPLGKILAALAMLKAEELPPQANEEIQVGAPDVEEGWGE